MLHSPPAPFYYPGTDDTAYAFLRYKMRFKVKQLPNWGDERFRTFFAWFPVANFYEIRWLEKVSVRETFSSENGWSIEEFL